VNVPVETARETTTSPSERPGSESDWPSFVDAYGRVVTAWFRQTGLPATDVQRIIRTLFVYFHKEFVAVEKEPDLRFRAWLQYAGHTSWCRAVEILVEEHGEDSNSPMIPLLLSVQAHDSFLHMLDAECSRWRRRELLIRVQALVGETDWECFYATVLEGRPIDDVAEANGLNQFGVRAAAQRVQQLLDDNYRQLEERF